jgi:hypothetical protein
VTNIGTPDYQRGVVSAQALLATVPANTATFTVGVPPNTETLAVIFPGVASVSAISCTGTTTGATYLGVYTQPQSAIPADGTYFFDVSSAIDASVTITVTNPPASSWYVYSDSGVHIVADVSKLTNNLRQQYVIDSVPAIDGGDHPPNELSNVVFDSVANGTQILPGPGAARRYRVFYVTLQVNSTGQRMGMSGGGQGLVTANSVSDIVPVTVDFKPTGIPLPTNGAISVNGTGGTANGHIVYTNEIV